jgi:hypothetical protein
MTNAKNGINHQKLWPFSQKDDSQIGINVPLAEIYFATCPPCSQVTFISQCFAQSRSKWLFLLIL